MTLAEGCLVHKNVSYERLSLVIPLTYGRFRALSWDISLIYGRSGCHDSCSHTP